MSLRGWAVEFFKADKYGIPYRLYRYGILVCEVPFSTAFGASGGHSDFFTIPPCLSAFLLDTDIHRLDIVVSRGTIRPA